MKLIGYARISKADRTKKGKIKPISMSVEAQCNEIQSWCRQHGHELLDIKKDIDKSGALAPEARAGLSLALEEVRSKRAEGIVVRHTDRLSRGFTNAIDLFDMAEVEGWTIHSIVDPMSYKTADDRFKARIMASVAAHEREKTAERVRLMQAELKRRGMAYAGTPYGWKRVAELPLATDPDDQKYLLIEDATEQRMLAVISAHRSCLKPNTYVHIANVLNGEGFRKRNGKPLDSTIVSQIAAAMRKEGNK